MAVTAGVVLVSAAITVINGIKRGKARRLGQATAVMEVDDQERLSQELLRAKTVAERQIIIKDAIVKYSMNKEALADIQRLTMYWIAGGLGASILIIAIIVAIKKR